LKEVDDDLLASATLSYRRVGNVFWQLGDYAQAEKYYIIGISKSKNQGLDMESEIPLCCIAISKGDYAKARDLLNDLHPSVKSKDNRWNYAFFVRVYAELEWGMGNYPQAEKWLAEFEKMVAASNLQDVLVFDRTKAVFILIELTLSKKDWDGAAEQIRSALNLQNKIKGFWGMVFDPRPVAVSLAAVLALAQRKSEKAARLLGSANQSYQAYRLTFPLFRRQLIDQTIEDTRNALDEATFTTAWEQGRAMGLNEASAYALQVLQEIQTSI
jgi:tetratricopeptide (TPR) repeat protein